MIWFSVAALALIAELLTGTFYLLVLSLAFFIVGCVTYFLAISPSAELILAAVLSLVGLFAVHRWHKKNKLKKSELEAISDLDLNQHVVIVDVLPTDIVSIHYRGTQWQAKLLDVEQLDKKLINQQARIVGRDKNVFLIKLVTSK